MVTLTIFQFVFFFKFPPDLPGFLNGEVAISIIWQLLSSTLLAVKHIASSNISTFPVLQKRSNADVFFYILLYFVMQFLLDILRKKSNPKTWLDLVLTKKQKKKKQHKLEH